MLQSNIRRIKVALPCEEELMIPSLAEEARELLGYNPTEDEASYSKLSTILKTLVSLEIEILNWRDVLSYQLEKQHEKEKELLTQWLADTQFPQWREQIQWRCTALREYKGFVPSHALQKALEIKRALPDVFIFIEHLEQSKDPFLLISSSEHSWGRREIYYIEVWGEPTFERGM